MRRLCKLSVWMAVGAITLRFAPCVNAEETRELLASARKAASGGESRLAVQLATQVLEREPQLADAYYVRGREQFRLGEVMKSVDDFDQYVRRQPDQTARLWERGISCYYAKQYRAGAKQFAEYQDFDDSDVENAVWHALCVSAADGPEAARRGMMRVQGDRRVPMMDVYRMFRGEMPPADVLRVVEQAELSDEARHTASFYAHLYVGLYYESQGDKRKSRHHIKKAAEDFRVSHYMWDVARVHLTR